MSIGNAEIVLPVNFIDLKCPYSHMIRLGVGPGNSTCITHQTYSKQIDKQFFPNTQYFLTSFIYKTFSHKLN